MITAARRLSSRLGMGGTIALAVLLMLLVMAAAGQAIAPYGPEYGSIPNAYAAPSAAYWLGTDSNGFDVLSRLIIGARTSLFGSAGVILLSLIVGIPPALAAAWRGGLVDTIVSRIADVLFGFPGLLLAVLAVALFGSGLSTAVVAIAISYLPYIARVVRSAALQQRVQPYVAALEVQGVSGFTICTRHIMPNIASIVLAQSTLAFGYALSDLAALSFLGLAVQAPQADWGVLVNDQNAMLTGHPLQVLVASGFIVATIVAITMLGDRIARDDTTVIRRRRGRTPRQRSARSVQAARPTDSGEAPPSPAVANYTDVSSELAR